MFTRMRLLPKVTQWRLVYKMETGRRGFLKALTATALVATTPAGFIESKPVAESDFNPDDKYGNSCPYSGKLEASDWIKQLLYEDMKKVVPEEYRYRVQFRLKIPTDYGRSKAMAWYYSPNINVLWGENYGVI